MYPFVKRLAYLSPSFVTASTLAEFSTSIGGNDNENGTLSTLCKTKTLMYCLTSKSPVEIVRHVFLCQSKKI